MKKTTLLLLLLALTSIAFAQRGNQKWYNLALGGRIETGNDSNDIFGVSFEKALSTVTSIELLALTNLDSGIEFAGIYKYIAPFPEVPPSLRWFVGGGAHVGFWGNDMVIGADGLLGFGYTFNEIPLNITLDWHPVLNIIQAGDNKFWPAKFGLTGRYIIE